MKDPAAVKLGKKGGRASWQGLTKEQRSERARRNGSKRWEKKGRRKKAALVELEREEITGKQDGV